MLYYFDTGRWIIKVRADAVSVSGKAILESLDEFVRAQRWEALALTGQSCTGTACNAVADEQ